jgi:cytochrome c biogenesis protein ResB
VRVLLRFLQSVRLATVLIIVIVALAAASTFIPQGRPPAWYEARYPRAVAQAMRVLRLSDFFSSALFLAPVGLFTLNLGACTVGRIGRRTRARVPHRHGPDILHAGLLLLIAAGLLTALASVKVPISLAEGEEAAVSPACSLRLVSFAVVPGPAGGTRDYASTVRVTLDGKDAGTRTLGVNHPLRLGGTRVYQSSWDATGTLTLTDADGGAVDPPPVPGDYFTWQGALWTFTGWEQAAGGWRAAFTVAPDGGTAAKRLFAEGDRIGPFAVRGISVRAVSGLVAVRDPGRIPFLAGAILVLAGLCIGFIQKRGDVKG